MWIIQNIIRSIKMIWMLSYKRERAFKKQILIHCIAVCADWKQKDTDTKTIPFEIIHEELAVTKLKTTELMVNLNK